MEQLDTLVTRSSKPEIRFWSRVNKEGTIHPIHGQCWEWTAGKFSQGYGNLWVNGKPTKTHRYSYILNVGPIPEGKDVLHKCDNRLCVNPLHLFIGTDIDNVRDCLSKERHIAPKGERCAKAVLTDEQVKYIRTAYSEKKEGKLSLAIKFGVTKSTIHKILKRRTWKHV